jgi:hypothetical protein
MARPAVRAYMMSLVSVRRIQLAGEFIHKFPHSWLVWEPGVWQPAKGAAAPTRIGGMAAAGDKPSQGDALCFELAESRPLRVGRAPDGDIVLNDATVSREHLILEASSPGHWTARPASAATSALLDDQPLTQKVALMQGMRLKLGDVLLTFHDPEGFARRLDETIEAARE